jgi:hypothetical protein
VSRPSSYRSRRGHIHLLRVLPLVGCRSKTPTSTSHSSAKKDLALNASDKGKSKKIKEKAPSSSSESDDPSDSSEAESDDDKLALLMRKTTRMLFKIGKKGYNYDPKKQKF